VKNHKSVFSNYWHESGVLLRPFSSKSDIERLVSDAVVERRTLEYKVELPGGSDEAKKEFLYDVSSFANAAGGTLIFGIQDQRDSSGKPTGIPERVVGLTVSNVSAEVARLEGSINSGISPRIAGISFDMVDEFQPGPVLVLNVPRSWAAPHLVTFKGTNKFYGRNTTGKYPMDVNEIRNAFAATTEIPLESESSGKRELQMP
jgi:predicted HTH transcriptional regulator